LREGPPRLALAVASVGGIGFAPFAPGTFGSLPGLALYWALHAAGGWPLAAAGLGVVCAAGVWAGGVAERHWGAKDPGRVVIDETAGQMLALLLHAPAPSVLAASFVLFRIFDVWKPFPARRLEELPAGSGIMADDLAAGVYANLALAALGWALPGWIGGA
jgi:phosphatidylglycerophosphatase A